MNTEIKHKWVEALRSGEYQQRRTFLHADGKFCCLGVLCDLYSKEENVPWENVHAGNVDVLTMEGAQGVLPTCVMLWAGIHGSNQVSVSGTDLVRLNDGFGVVEKKSFSEIADIIEKEL